jgi:mRNA interferase MazF
MRRGELYQANLDPTVGSEQGGARPVLIVSRDALNANAPIVIVVPLTRREHKTRLYPSHVELRVGEGGLSKDSVALCEQIRVISKERIAKRIGQLSGEVMAKVEATLLITLDLGLTDV